MASPLTRLERVEAELTEVSSRLDKVEEVYGRALCIQHLALIQLLVPLAADEVREPGDTDDTVPLSTRERLERFIEAEQPCRFDYTDAEGKESLRTISPYRIDGVDYLTSVIGWDHDREGIRQFRIARIDGVVTPTWAVEFREPEDS